MIYVKIGESSNSPNPLDLSANDFGSLETSTSSASGIHISCHQIFLILNFEPKLIEAMSL